MIGLGREMVGDVAQREGDDVGMKRGPLYRCLRPVLEMRGLGQEGVVGDGRLVGDVVIDVKEGAETRVSGSPSKSLNTINTTGTYEKVNEI